ncbi:MAG: OmpH family outer membrane protein [Limnochordia bacterium]|jgi:outer membrane protein
MRVDKKVVGLIVLGALVLTLGATTFSQSQGSAEIAYVDSQALLSRYVIPKVEPILTQELEMLQSEFDEKTSEMEIEEKQRIFEEYQSQLDARREQLVEEALQLVQKAIEEVALAEGVDVILDNQVVLFGGQDLTQRVLDHLNR